MSAGPGHDGVSPQQQADGRQHVRQRGPRPRQHGGRHGQAEDKPAQYRPQSVRKVILFDS